MVGKLRNEGMMIYENRSSNGVSYRVNAFKSNFDHWYEQSVW